ncbi:UV-endonuclease UvdE-domain-containing protein [Geopyxis carbonaria]|nr:UV-endonuclease UvdE-domain-containing protein [Geopyxis carbonaria]
MFKCSFQKIGTQEKLLGQRILTRFIKTTASSRYINTTWLHHCSTPKKVTTKGVERIMPKRKRGTAAITAAPPSEGIDSSQTRQGSPGDEGSPFEPSEVESEQTPGELVPVVKNKAIRKKKTKEELKEDEEPKERPPETNSDYLPIPWKGRIGYACLNTYLRTSNPPIFCSRTCRIETILKQGGYENGGLEYVQSLGLANAKDLSKMILWNEKYGIKFLRISSEMFPFASHKVYGYNLDFAREALGEAGKLAMDLGHRLTTHPGQFTQLGSPRPEVIEASVKDLEYHSQLFQNLGLKGQADKDAVMILHMGGMFGDKGATLDRFRENYTTLLSDDIKARLVLENDDVIWSVHDLLPICEELNIPMVLDYHHHNIIHDPSLRAGTLDIMTLFDRIKATWTRKGIKQKQHYSEPCPGTVTGREMRKHSPRVARLPPCADDMDLMIEAKDKEQAVFELYRKYNIGGEGLFNEVIPHERIDDNKPPKKTRKKKGQEEEAEEDVSEKVPENDVGMGGAERRVYWPEGKEEWLSPAKRVRKKKEEDVSDTAGVEGAEKKPKARARKAAVKKEDDVSDTGGVETTEKKPKARARKTAVKKEEQSEGTESQPSKTTKTASTVQVKHEEQDDREVPNTKKKRVTKKAAIANPEKSELASSPAKKSTNTTSTKTKTKKTTLPLSLSNPQSKAPPAEKAAAIEASHVEDSSEDSPLSELETDTEEAATQKLKKEFLEADQHADGRRRSRRLAKV